MERHPELFEDSKTYEKLDEGYTWVQGESLDDIEARADDIRTEELKRQQQSAKRRRPKTLAEAFTGEFDEPEEESGCLICHLWTIMASDKQDFLRFVNTLENLHFNKKGERVRPHKLIMLLAVAELFENGTLKDNRIYFDDSLTQTFTDIFERYQLADDMSQPSIPFFHLRTADFWHHKTLPGMEESYQKLNTSGGGTKRIHDHIEYAYLSDYAFNVMQDTKSRTKVIGLIEGTIKAMNKEQ